MMALGDVKSLMGSGLRGGYMGLRIVVILVLLGVANAPNSASASQSSYLKYCLMGKKAPSSIQKGIKALQKRIHDSYCETGDAILRRTRTLSLRNKGLSDLELIQEMTELKKLSLANNGVEKIGPLSKLTKLQRINLKGNKIVDILPLAGLPQLVNLDLTGNKITDVRPLAKLPRLRRLFISGNPVEPGNCPTEGDIAVALKKACKRMLGKSGKTAKKRKRRKKKKINNSLENIIGKFILVVLNTILLFKNDKIGEPKIIISKILKKVLPFFFCF